MDHIQYAVNIVKFLAAHNDDYYVDPKDGVSKLKSELSQRITQFPWIFHGDNNLRACNFWSDLYWKAFGIIYSHCAEKCYKIVIKLPNVESLFKLNSFMDDVHKLIGGPDKQPCAKCGIDFRKYTDNRNVGFIYCESLQGAKRTARYFIDNLRVYEILFDDLFIKRGCTEFENRAPSKDWKVTQDQIQLEQKIKRDIEHLQPVPLVQPEWGLDVIKLFWAQEAYSIGDQSYKNTPYGPYVKTSKPAVRY